MKALLGVAIALLGIFAICAVSLYSAKSTGNRLINDIEAAYEQNQNVLSSVTGKVAELAQVPGMMAEDMQAVIAAALSARYGEDGSKAMFQMIQEQNPQLDSAVYTKLQQAIESGRDDFQLAQKRLIDLKRVYKTAAGSPWKGIWMNATGYTAEKVDKYHIVIDDSTERAFETGKREPMKLR